VAISETDSLTPFQPLFAAVFHYFQCLKFWVHTPKPIPTIAAIGKLSLIPTLSKKPQDTTHLTKHASSLVANPSPQKGVKMISVPSKASAVENSDNCRTGE
jgi:hypothetical protein